jgi:hypothetical protein
MNKTPIVIVIVAILVLCCCSTCALGCTLYFFSKAGDLPQHEERVPSVNSKVSADEYVDEYASGYDYKIEDGVTQRLE